jgi:hypothetical protein
MGDTGDTGDMGDMGDMGQRGRRRMRARREFCSEKSIDLIPRICWCKPSLRPRKPRSSHRRLCVSSSAKEPIEMEINRPKSAVEFRPAPSAMFDTTETAARRICACSPKRSSIGIRAVSRYTSPAICLASFHTSKSSWLRIPSLCIAHLRVSCRRPLLRPMSPVSPMSLVSLPPPSAYPSAVASPASP